MTFKELLERTLAEIDRQTREAKGFTPEQALIWTLAAGELDRMKSLYHSRPNPEKE